VTDAALTSIAVPFATRKGRRVLSADYSASGLALDALVAHTISYPEHNVYIVDSAGRLVASSPETNAVTLAQADPELARSAAHATHGPVEGSATPSTFTAAPVPGTTWRLAIAVPDKRLYASISGPTRYVPWFVFALVTIIGGLLVALFARSLADRERLTKLSATMRRTAQTDSLTGLYNRRALTEHLTRASARARRHDEPLSVLMIDLDRFKQTNDTFGHEAGDQVLCTVADCMREALRVEDVYGRWGGDEFLVALPLTDVEGAEVSAARLRRAAASVDLESIGLEHGVPLSIGVACGTHTSPIELIREADLALYRAKADGRSRVPASR
jgi:diguanylate cyclase (GGDEF)-like protein